MRLHPAWPTLMKTTISGSRFHAQGETTFGNWLIAKRALSLKTLGISTGWGPDTPSDISSTELHTYVQRAVALGVHEFRLDYFSLGDPKFIRVADAAYAAGISVMPVIGVHDGTSALTLDARTRDVLARYPQIERVEAGNEVNAPAYGGPPDPDQYAAQLQAIFAAAKKVNPAVRVISSGLAPVGASSAGSMNHIAYYNALLAATRGQGYDLVGWHPYGDWAYSFNDDIFEIMGKPLALTEMGYSTGYDATDAMGADILTRQLHDVLTNSTIDSAYVYSLLDRNTPDREGHFGLHEVDWTPKPSASVFALAAAR